MITLPDTSKTMKIDDIKSSHALIGSFVVGVLIAVALGTFQKKVDHEAAPVSASRPVAATPKQVLDKNGRPYIEPRVTKSEDGDEYLVKGAWTLATKVDPITKAKQEWVCANDDERSICYSAQTGRAFIRDEGTLVDYDPYSGVATIEFRFEKNGKGVVKTVYGNVSRDNRLIIEQADAGAIMKRMSESDQTLIRFKSLDGSDVLMRIPYLPGPKESAS